MAKLTVRALDALKPRVTRERRQGERGYKVTVDRGLYLRVANDGTKSWLVRYVVGGQQLQARLPKPYGSASDDAHLSLAQALAENGRIQSLARDGIDFQRLRAEQAAATEEARKAAAAADVSFRALFGAWLLDGVSRKDGNAELRRSFEKDLMPWLAALRAREVADTELRDALRRVGRGRGRARTAERLLSDLHQMYRWALRRPQWRAVLLQGNPADLVDLREVAPHGYQPTFRQRTLSPEEIQELWTICRQLHAQYDASADKRSSPRPLQPETQLALWLCLGTGCRIGELLMSRWEHVDLENAVWFVPASNTKTQAAWYVFLSDFALGQFRSLRTLTGNSEWCYPSRSGLAHVSVKTVSKQVGDRQVRFKNRTPLARRRHDDSLVLDGGRRGEWTPHDLRRTAATMMQALGVNPDVIDRCQNHVLAGSKVRRHYLHHDYAKEKQAAWQALGRQLEAIVRGAPLVVLPKAA
jgi:integrase